MIVSKRILGGNIIENFEFYLKRSYKINVNLFYSDRNRRKLKNNREIPPIK